MYARIYTSIRLIDLYICEYASADRYGGNQPDQTRGNLMGSSCCSRRKEEGGGWRNIDRASMK